MANYKQMADYIIEMLVKENINSAVHCMTRLRFKLKDKDLAHKEEIEAMHEVQGVRYQVTKLSLEQMCHMFTGKL